MLNMKLISSDTEGELQLIGRLDKSTAKNAETHMVEAGNRFDTLILDMAQLEYVSSAGLRASRQSCLSSSTSISSAARHWDWSSARRCSGASRGLIR